MTAEQLDRIADRVREAARHMLSAGYQGVEVDVPELGEVIVVSRDTP